MTQQTKTPESLYKKLQSAKSYLAYMDGKISVLSDKHDPMLDGVWELIVDIEEIKNDKHNKNQ